MPKQNNYTQTQEKLTVIRQAMNSKNAKVAKRASMVYNLHQGYTPEAVAQIHAVSVATVYNWFNRFQTDGLDGLSNKPKAGRPPKATVTYRHRLMELIETNRHELGLGFSVWTLPSLQAFMERETGVYLSQNRISEILHEEGYVYRRPKKDLGHQQDTDLRRQVQEAIDEVKKTAPIGQFDYSIWTKADSV